MIPPKPLAPLCWILLCLLLAGSACKRHGGGARGSAGAGPAAATGAFPLSQHVAQASIAAGTLGFQELFDMGDQLFEARFNELDGAGALLLPDGTPLPGRFSRTPPGGGRFTGPNESGCDVCHHDPFPTSAGGLDVNVLQDPAGLGLPPFNPRNTISLFGDGVIQRLAEEITDDLLAIRGAVTVEAKSGALPITRALVSKGISFGVITVRRDARGLVRYDLSGLRGIDPDLVVRPFGWKGNVPNLRTFNRGAARDELGMEPDELVVRDPLGHADPDGDGITGELSVGDLTAITIYSAAQEIPTTLERMARDGLRPPLSDADASRIERGRSVFLRIGCADCHTRELRLDYPIFEEPTRRGGGNYRDPKIDPSGGLDPDHPAQFNLATEGDPPRLEALAGGGFRVELWGDLRRHAMGRQLADGQEAPIVQASGDRLMVNGSPAAVPRMVFLTAELWGVGNTGPWLHDGRAATLEEAILLHGEEAPPPSGDPERSEAQESRDAFAALGELDRDGVVGFLESLVLFSFPGD